MSLEFIHPQVIARRIVPGGTLVYLAAAVGGVGLGAYLGRMGSSLPLVAPLAIAGLLAAATIAPGVALVVGLAAMALPYTWGPNIPKLGFGMGILVGLLLAISQAARLWDFRPTALDLAVSVFAVTPAAITAFQGGPFHVTQWFAPVILFPYAGFRLLLNATDARRAFGPAMIVIGVVVSLIGIWEELSGHNPVVKAGSVMYGSGGTYITSWNVPGYRDGHLRALSTFGHPIAFGMFLLIPLAFALARRGTWNLIAVGIILVAEVVTYSRGPWIGVIVVVMLLANRGRVLLVAGGLVLAALFVGPIHRLLLESTSASTEPGHNTYYRVGLLSHAIHDITPLGHPLTDLQTAIPDFPDVTSLLAGTIIQTGVVGLAELLLIVALAISALLEAHHGTDRDYYAATVALTAQFAGLVGVTLITNYEFFFWALVAYVATAHQRHAAGRQGAREDTDAGNLTRRGGAGVIQSAGT
jgi:hypothetical protein